MNDNNGNRFSRLTRRELQALYVSLLATLEETDPGATDQPDRVFVGALLREMDRERTNKEAQAAERERLAAEAQAQRTTPPGDLRDVDQLRAYIETGRGLGGFLSAIVSGDLILAARRADGYNLPRLHLYVAWLDANAPAVCYGSAEAVADWMSSGGLRGRRAQGDHGEA